MEEEDVVQCPYNSSHLILKRRMAAHLIKCRVQYPSVNFTTCPFNSTHDVPAPELKYHSENCPDRKKLDSFMYVTEESKPLPVMNVDLPESKENWDEEDSIPSYLEVKDKIIESQPIFRKPVGMSKAERKAFFQKEKLRFNNFSNDRKES